MKPMFPGGVTFTVRPRASNSYSVQYTGPPGAYGRETRFARPTGEQAQGAYSVSVMETDLDD